MARDRRRQGETERPALRRPSNPGAVAKAAAAPGKAQRVSRLAREKKKRDARSRPLPASVTMEIAAVLRGEVSEPSSGSRSWGILYRFVVRDAEERPLEPGSFTIRRHVIHVASGGCFATIEKGARITIVSLDRDSAGRELAGAREAAGEIIASDGGELSVRLGAGEEGEERSLEYFSFEMGGVTCAIPESGFSLARSWKDGRFEIARAPRAVPSVHGEVVPGRVSGGAGDTYVLSLRG